jgi:hypothetical protein
LQGFYREIGGHTAKIPEQDFGPLPGLGMLGAATAPLLDGLTVCA